MANETSYIGVAMGLDVTDLKAGLQEASKRIGEANADFRAASSGMDDWQKSTEGLSAKVTQLDKVLAAQQSKLGGLKYVYDGLVEEQNKLQQAYDKTVASQGKNSKAAQELKDKLDSQATAVRNAYIKMQNQQAVVNQTQRELSNYRETLKLAEDGTIDLTQVTLRAGRAIQTASNDVEEASGSFAGFAKAVGGGLAAVGGIVAGAVTGFFTLAESTREAREDMAKLTSSFAGAGLSGESAKSTFTELYKVIGETDTAVEASQQIALLAKSEEEAAKWAELATGVTATFGDALKPETFYEAANETLKLGEATGAFTQMLEGTGINVETFNAELATMTTEQEKQAYMLKVSEEAMGAAGKAYEETAGSIMEAREAEAQLSLAMQELGAIAEPIMTTLKLLAVDLLEAMKPFVELIGNGLTAAFNGSADGASMLAEGIGGILNMLVEKFTTLIPTVLEIILQLVPTIVNSLLEQLPQLLNLIVDLVIQVINMVTQMLPQIVDAIIEVVPILINELIKAIPQLLQAAIQLLMAIVEAIPTIIKALIDALPSIISTIVSTLLSNLPMIIKAAVQLFMGILKAIPQIQLELLRTMPQIISGIIGGLIKGIPEMIKAGKDMLEGLIKGLVDVGAIGKAIKKLGDNIVGGVKNFFGIHSPSKLMEEEIGQYLGLGIGQGVIDSIPQVKQQLNKFSNFVTDNLSGIKSGFAIEGAGAGGRFGSTINAPLTINYNGNLSRKEIKQLSNDNFNSILTKLKAQGVV